MRWVVFLRAVNVGKHNRFQPSVLAKELAKFGLINIGAVGTFVVREEVSEATLRNAILRKLPFRCDVMICPAKDMLDLARAVPLTDEPLGNDLRAFVTVMAKRPRRLPKLPIYAPNIDQWEVKVVRITGLCALSLWRRLKENALYPNQIIEKEFGVATTTRSWNTILKVAKILGA
jgi:uncharacterized protein (DUF1697 family)